MKVLREENFSPQGRPKSGSTLKKYGFPLKGKGDIRLAVILTL